MTKIIIVLIIILSLSCILKDTMQNRENVIKFKDRVPHLGIIG